MNENQTKESEEDKKEIKKLKDKVELQKESNIIVNIDSDKKSKENLENKKEYSKVKIKLHKSTIIENSYESLIP